MFILKGEENEISTCFVLVSVVIKDLEQIWTGNSN